MNASLAEISKATSAGKFLGSVVWWNQEQSAMSTLRFAEIWIGAGLDGSLLPDQPPPARALRDAGIATLRGRGNRGSDFLLRPAGNKAGVWYYALISEKRYVAGTGEPSLQHGQVASFSVNPEGFLYCQLHSTDTEVLQKAQAIEVAYNKIWGTFQPRDIRESIMRALRNSRAVPLREHGGIYWVPAPYQPTANALKTVLDACGNSEFSILPIHSTDQGMDAIRSASTRSLESDLRELTEQLDKWAVDAAHDDGPQTRSVMSMITEFNDLESRTELYRDILELQTESLKERLVRARTHAQQILAVL